MPQNSSIESDLQLLELARQELRTRIQSGEAFRSESLFASYPSLADDPVYAIQLIVEEILLRRANGQEVSSAELIARFPQWERKIAEQLAAHQENSGIPCSNHSKSAGVSTQPLLRESTPELPTARIGHFELIEEVGEGGMGTVFKVRHVLLKQIFAMKTITNGVWAGSSDVQRFLRESKAVATLDHPNIVRVYEIGSENKLYYFTMPLLTGGSLKDRKSEFAEFRAMACLMEKLARAMEYAHQKGIVHRDLKPGNILFEGNEPKITDFGLAKLLDADNEISLTPRGNFIGTPSYASPEQLLGKKDAIGCASDIWSLGVIMYELIAGSRPFRGDSQTALRERVVRMHPDSLLSVRRDCPTALDTISRKCLAKEPTDRYPSAVAVAEDLRLWLDGKRIIAQPRKRGFSVITPSRRIAGILLAVALSLLAVAAAFFFTKKTDRPESDPPMKTARDNLEKGQSLSLVENGILPTWSRWVSGQAGKSGTSSGKETVLTSESLGTALLELFPSVPCKQFQIRAEILHEDDAQLGDVGLFLGYQQAICEAGTLHYFFELSYNDRDAILESNPGEAPLSAARFTFRYLLDAGRPNPDSGTKGLGMNHYYRPPLELQQPVTYRTLIVRVTEESIEPFWEQRSLGKADFQHLQEVVESYLKPYNLDNPSVDFRAGLGVYVFRGKAAIKSMVIEPLE